MCLQTAGAQAIQPNEAANLNAEINLAPKAYAANATYSPLYTQLQMNNLDTFLNGTNGTPGFLSEYTDQIMPALTSAQTAANTATRTANLNDAAALTPMYIGEERAANPGAASLLDTLTSNTSRDLGYGTELTPAEQVQFNQTQRAGAAARGLGMGPSDVFNESLADTGYGQQLYQERMGAAESLVPTLQSFYGNPTAAISGMGSNAGLTTANLDALASGSATGAGTLTANEFNPANQMAQQYAQNTFEGNLAEADAYNQAFTQGASQGMGVMSGAGGQSVGGGL